MIFIYILIAVLLFGLLIAIHEFGHFIAAKKLGIRVNEFAIGMGPAIFKKKKGDTLYALRLLPIGGFCAMEGEDSKSDDPRAFGSKSVFARIIVVLAGSFMNLVAGFLVLAIVFAPVKEWAIPTVDTVTCDTTLPENALHEGDVVKSIDGYNVYIFGDISMGLTRGGDDGVYDIKVLRDGNEIMLEDVMFSGEGNTGENSGEPAKSYEIRFAVEKSSFGGKIKYIFQNGVNLVRLVKVGLEDLLSGKVSTDELSGPVGIGKVMADTAKVDMSSLWYLVAFISINLGIMNLLPLPALDGGRFVFLLIELIFRRPVPQKYEAFIHLAGIAILMALMLFVTFNDVFKLFAN